MPLEHAPRRGVSFDPTFNLGQVGQMIMLAVSITAMWMTFDARVTRVEKALETLSQRTAEQAKETKEERVGVETRLMARIQEEKARVDADRATIAYEIRDLKDVVRQGLRDIKTDIDRKQDKPGR